MTTKTTSTTNDAGVPPAPPEAHQRAVSRLTVDAKGAKLLAVIAAGYGVSTREYLEGLIHYAVSQWERPGSWEAASPFDFRNYTEGGYADRWF
jgi:hypothetical protein